MINNKPMSRTEYYLDYLNNGGNLENLPLPINRSEYYLFNLCKNGIGASDGENNQVSNENIILDYVYNENEVLEIESIDFENAIITTKKPHGIDTKAPVIVTYKSGFLVDFDHRVVPEQLYKSVISFEAERVTDNSLILWKRTSSTSATRISSFTKSSYVDITKFQLEKAPGLLEIDLVKKYRNINIEIFNLFGKPFKFQLDTKIIADNSIGYIAPTNSQSPASILTKIDINIDDKVGRILSTSVSNYFSISTHIHYSSSTSLNKAGLFYNKKYVDKFTLDFEVDYSGGCYLPNGMGIRVKNLGDEYIDDNNN